MQDKCDEVKMCFEIVLFLAYKRILNKENEELLIFSSLSNTPLFIGYFVTS